MTRRFKYQCYLDKCFLVAAYNNNVRDMKTLLVLGASLEYEDIEGLDAMFYAVRNQSNGAVKLLCELGANVNKYYRKTRLGGFKKIFRINMPLFIVAFEYGNTATLDLLVRAKADIEATDSLGMDVVSTLYVTRGFNKNYENMRWLIINGVYLDHVARIMGSTALSKCVRSGLNREALLLLNGGASIILSTYRGRSLLKQCTATSKPVAETLMLKYKRNPDEIVNIELQVLCKPTILWVKRRELLSLSESSTLHGTGSNASSAIERYLFNIYVMKDILSYM